MFDDERHGPLPAFLLLLTLVTGLVDAVSYLRLGHVFVANMTGNVVFLGFGLAGATDVSALASLVAIVAFAAGAIAGGRLNLRFGEHRGRLLSAAAFVNLAFVAFAAAVAGAAGAHASDPARYLLIIALSIAMGLQNAVARRIGVPDLTTTVLTLTLTGIAADSRLAGGNQPRLGRRLLSVVAMLAGAGMGGAIVLTVGVGAALATAAILLIITGGGIARFAQPKAAWATAPPS